MENDSIVITAKLDVVTSAELIKDKDLPDLERRLANSPIKISCTINEDSISQMQSQLSEISKNLTINLGNANVENAKVEIIPDIKKGVLEQQAKQLQQELGLLFPYGETEKLREELKGYLNEYQKAYQAENGYGEQAQAHMEKIVDFANKYRQEMVLINETLKAEQDRIREIRKEQEKVFITAEQMAALNREAKQNGTTAQAMLNSVLPNGWYSDINKLPAGKMPYYWSQFATEVNSINPFREIANEGDIVQGIRDLTEFMSKSFTSVDNTIEKNRTVWEQWAETIRGTVGEVTGRNPFADFFSGFVDITGETQNFANSMENVQERVVQTVNVIQQSLGGNDGLSNVNFRINNQAIETFINELNQLDIQGINIDKLRERLQSLGVAITSISSKYGQVGRTGEQLLNSLTVEGKDSANNIVTYIENFDKKTGEFTDATTKVKQNLAQIRKEEQRVESETKALRETLNEFLKLEGTFKLYGKKYGGDESLRSQFDELQTLIDGFKDSAPIEKQRESIIRIDSALKILKVDIDEINKAATRTVPNVENIYPNISFTRGDSSASILANAKEQLNTYFNENQISNSASRIKRAVEDATGSLNKFYVQIEREDGAVETVTYALNEQANAYEYLSKITREADNSTDFRRRGLSTQIELQTQKLEEFATTVGKSGEASNVLSEDIANLRNELARLRNDGDTNAMNAFLDNFDIAKAKFQSLNSETKVVEASIKKLNQLLNNTQFRNNANNPAVSQQRADIEALRTEYEKLLGELSNARDPQSLQTINTRLAELKPQFDAVVQSSTELNNSLKDSDASAKFAAKLNQLKNQVEIFANTNRRATESLKQMRNGMTFAEEWQRIVSQLKSGNLDENAIRRLSEDLRNFKGEAQSAGLTVNKFFQSMSSQLKMVMQRWVSLYAIIGRITSAFNELKSVDKILTEIAKSSDVTRESLESLGNAAFDMANKYGRSVTDYLYGVQEFSRAGFRGEQLTGLTEVSLLAQSAGDIETDLANSYVIATNAAYGFAGSQEELGEVLDRQNYVTNNYALNMTDLANATKIAASQAAQSGVEIDQMTAALATMISTTQQGGEIAARSLRGILMNIQQVKGEVGDGEEDITAESLTKYEKAAKDLGVALKEVKDGASVLRDPMAVLNDLAEAFNKEADDSIKKANLINAIGGKFYLVA